MASSSKTPDVLHKVLPSGDHALGIEIDGVFVPFVQKDGAYIASLAEAGKSPEAEAAADDEKGGGE